MASLSANRRSPTGFDYRVERSARRQRTLSLSVAADGQVLVRAPLRASIGEIDAFVLQRSGWVMTRLAAVSAAPPAAARQFASGEEMLFDGEMRTLEVVPEIGRRRVHVVVTVRTLLLRTPVHATVDQRGGWVERWYRARAIERATDLVPEWSRVMGLRPTGVIVRDQKRRWGSCSATGVIRLNWRLAMMPPGVFAYVVVHELAHLRQRNHSPAFWSEVERWLPECQERRTELRAFERRIDW